MHKKLFFILFIFTISCNQKEEVLKDYALISGLISNNKSKNIDITSKGFDKRIKVNIDGTFKDTVKLITNGFYKFSDGKNELNINISNGNKIDFKYDYNDFEESIKFSGIGSETTEYLLKRKKLNIAENLSDYQSFFKLEPNKFIEKTKFIDEKFEEMLSSPNIDSLFKENEQKRTKNYIAYLKKNYSKNHSLLIKLAKGKSSPIFNDYENNKGRKLSLKDFLGKYVYINIWATWNSQCKEQIPFFNSLEEEFRNKNIEFISISLDDGRGYNNDKKLAKNAWKKFIKNNNLRGTNLIADKGWNSNFIKEYNVRTIPFFILLDKEGKIIDRNTKLPSDETLKQIFNKLLE